MKEGFKPKLFKNYSPTLAEQIKLDKFLKENLEKGYIRPSQLPMAAPFSFFNKKDGKLWLCLDYWYLNDWTIKNSYPLPLISEIMDKLKGTKYFTRLDVCWGYNNIQIRKGDEWKAAFRANKALFAPTVMFFGMCNSLATFQSMMDKIFITMIKGKLVIVYMENILIFAGTKEELTQITKMVLEKLQENDLFLKAKKCKFYKTKIEYLGVGNYMCAGTYYIYGVRCKIVVHSVWPLLYNVNLVENLSYVVSLIKVCFGRGETVSFLEVKACESEVLILRL